MIGEYVPELLLALGIFAAGFLVIGPNILAVMGTSMAQGRQNGAMLALGIGLGSGIWATLAVAGLAALMTTYAWMVTGLKLAGAAYLAYLAYKSFRSALHPGTAALAEGLCEGGNMILRGLTIQMTNPKAAMQWIAIVSIGLGPDAPWQVGTMLVVSASALSILGHLAYSLTFSSGPVIAFYVRGRRWIEGALGVFFAVAAVKLTSSRS